MNNGIEKQSKKRLFKLGGDTVAAVRSSFSPLCVTRQIKMSIGCNYASLCYVT